MKVVRRFTRSNADPYQGIEFSERLSEIRNPDGSVVFSMDEIMVPSSWSQFPRIAPFLRQHGSEAFG